MKFNTCDIVKSFEFLYGQREEKPRSKGITMVLDKGLGLASAESLVDLCGDYVDYLKFGWGTSVLYDEKITQQKIEMYRQHDITPYTGGTLFELAYYNEKFEEFLTEADRLGFPAIEVSDGSMNLPHKDKIKVIERIKDAGFEVLSEVGKKNPDLDKEFSVDERIELMQEELDAGSSLVIVEARESGKNIGIFDDKGNAKEDEIDEIVDKLDSNKILWEAPNKNQQVFFILKLGNEVNLGNISCDDIISLESLRRGLRGDTFAKF